jgi:putative transposase
MLRSTIKYKIEQIGGVFVEVPTRLVKPSQTCPKCGHQHKKTLDIRVHECSVCGYVQDRDIAAAEVMLYWAKGSHCGLLPRGDAKSDGVSPSGASGGSLPGLGTSLADAESSSYTSCTKALKLAGSMRQLGAKKRQKSVEVSANNEPWDVETHSSGGANCG